MRIAYLVSQYPAPSHTFIRREIDALRARGLEIETFSVRRPAVAELVSARDRADLDDTTYILPVSAARLAGAHLWALAARPRAYFATLATALGHRPPGFKAFLWALFHFAEAIVLARRLRERGIGHLHNHFANSGATVGMLAASFLGLPWSLTLHGISETDHPAGLLLGRKLARARFAACVSFFGRAQAMRVTPSEYWHKLTVVRCGVDLADLARIAPRRDERAAGAPRIVCVGRLSPEKGQAGLLQAVASLRARNVPCRLVLVGDGPARAEIERRAAELQLEELVEFRGRLGEGDTLAEIAIADILALPSFMEGLPIVLMEAMALGVPVVASRVAGVPELVEDGIGGLLFRPSDWSDLADKIAALASDPGLRARLARHARGAIEAEFDIHAAVRALPELYGASDVRGSAAAASMPARQERFVELGNRA